MLLNAQKRDMKPRFVSLVLSAGIIVLDQATKLIVTLTVPTGRSVTVIDDFFRIIHVQNPAIAFSIGRNLAAGTQRTLFGFLPLLVIALLLLYYLFTREKLTGFQRWTFAALLGGGLGNYVDRIFRPAGRGGFPGFPLLRDPGDGAMAHVQPCGCNRGGFRDPPFHIVSHPVTAFEGDHMSSGSKMVLFFLAATVFNLAVMAVLIVIFVIAARLVPVQAVSMAILFIGLIASIVLTFMIYAWVMKKVTVRFQLEKHIPQLFKGKRKG